MIEVETLIEEMQEVKLHHPAMEFQDILRLFNIKALQELSKGIMRVANG